MKRLFTLLIFLILLATNIYSQQQNYYVTSNSLNIRIEPNSDAEILVKLKKYDNIKSNATAIEGWIAISYKDYKGYVFSKYIKNGRARVSNYSVRTGAKCRDGSTSSATGRGACSHHGGVSYWLTKTKNSVRIEN